MAARQLARPPYVDPNTNIIYECDNPEYQGWLTKQSMWLKVSKEMYPCMTAVVAFQIVRFASLEQYVQFTSYPPIHIFLSLMVY